MVTVCGVAVGAEFGGSCHRQFRGADSTPVAGNVDGTHRDGVGPRAEVAGITAVSEVPDRVSGEALPTPGSAPIHHSPPANPDNASDDAAVRLVVCATSRDAGSKVTTGTDGAVKSTFTVSVIVVVRPAWLVDVPLRTSAPPSWVPVDCGGGHEAIPDPVSAHVYVADTPVFRHPAEFACGASAEVICGGDESIRMVTLAVPPSAAVTSITWVPSVRPAGVNGAR